MFQPAIVERLGYDLADRRQHSILAAQCVACGATICPPDHKLEVAPRHFGIADAHALHELHDHGPGMSGQECPMHPDCVDPIRQQVRTEYAQESSMMAVAKQVRT